MKTNATMRDELSLMQYHPCSKLVLPDHTPQCARFPVIDMHNHLWDHHVLQERVRIMNDVGVRLLINVTANTRFLFSKTGYHLSRVDFQEFLHERIPFADRFEGMTMSSFAKWGDFQIFGGNAFDFVEQTIAGLQEDVRRGALGLKITKELGLRFTDSGGQLVPIDDPRLSPIWDEAARLNVPVLIHSADPIAFFDPVDASNEHYRTLRKFSDWSFADSPVRFHDLLAQRDTMIARHPKTKYILPHFASWPENLSYVARLLDDHENVVIDLSARIDELGRQPYSTHDFIVRYQDRVLFGSDMPISREMYRTYFRFLETRDEYFAYPDYDGTYGVPRHGIYGINLPDAVLQKIYAQNAVDLFGLSMP